MDKADFIIILVVLALMLLVIFETGRTKDQSFTKHGLASRITSFLNQVANGVIIPMYKKAGLYWIDIPMYDSKYSGEKSSSDNIEMIVDTSSNLISITN